MSHQQALGPPVRRPDRSSARQGVRAASRILIRALPIAILLLSAALNWYELGTREVLGRDENVTIVHVDQPGLAAVLDTINLKFTGERGNMQPLYFLLQHLFWPLVGQSAFVLRFLPSVFGILTVAMTYKLGAALFRRPAALLGALLTAMLPLQIRYAQIARPYPLLAAFSLASAYFLVRAWQTGRGRYWAGFVLAAALGLYTHFNALFVLAAEGLAAAVAWLATLVAVVRGDAERRRLWLPVLAFALLVALCLPAVLELGELSWLRLKADGEAAGQITVELTKPFFRGFLFRSGVMSGWLQALVVGLAAVGLLAAALGRRWPEALLAALWISLPFLILSVVPSPRPFEERYVIFVLPVLLLLAGHGVTVAGRGVARLVPGSRGQLLGGSASAGLAAALILLLLRPLQVSYAYTGSASRLEEVLAVVEEHAGPGETVLVSPRFLVRPLRPSGAQVVYLAGHPSPAEIDAYARDSKRLWILCTSFVPPLELQEPLDRWLQAHLQQFARVPIKAVNAVAFGTLAAQDVEAHLQAQVAVLEELAAHPVDEVERWQRHSALADAYQALGDLYRDRGRPALAAEFWDRADSARAAAPPP
jgi:4-amino-4-deoxy-L-arabinose transferase-like glycosyltransferase